MHDATQCRDSSTAQHSVGLGKTTALSLPACKSRALYLLTDRLSEPSPWQESIGTLHHILLLVATPVWNRHKHSATLRLLSASVCALLSLQVSALGHSAGAHMWAMVLLDRTRAARRRASQKSSHASTEAAGQLDSRMPARLIGGRPYAACGKTLSLLSSTNCHEELRVPRPLSATHAAVMRYAIFWCTVQHLAFRNGRPSVHSGSCVTQDRQGLWPVAYHEAFPS